ncbi:MAG: tetratricopeptide repeat protein [Alphaproteobacteria bacterium]|nr:tetratricopeptide repeat protein [Alphaproteobacteria bacterium]MCW5742881.1 tetratricopeptide repeat protein [Alphaproteobacteria bacterium]
MSLDDADRAHEAGRLEEAVALYREALKRQPDSAEGWYGLGSAAQALGAQGEAAEALARSIACGASAAPVRLALGRAQFALGEVEAAIDQYARVEGAHRAMALMNKAVAIPGDPRADNAAVLRARRDWTRVEAARIKAAPQAERRQRTPGDKLRVGYVSSFFGAANWMKPVYGVINRHDRAALEVHMFADGGVPSAEVGYRDHDADIVHRIRNAGTAELADYIRRVGVDVLVDLNGFSVPGRLGLYLRRPAPAVIGWFNMFATSGMPGYGHIVGDEQVIPRREERHYGERVWRVPGSYLAFEVAYPVPDVAPPPCLANGHLTFGCLGSQYKITDGVIAAWAAILQRVPTARLHLRNGELSDESNRRALLGRFARAGIEGARIDMEGRAAHFDFLASYACVDIALDTFPYNGGTTTTEALWQGVPVLSFDGDRWASRTSKSLLAAAGLGDWCLDDQAAYVERAIALALDPAMPATLAEMRAGMRAHLLASPVCDCGRLCRALEDIYRQVAG